jgi:hypothetical protein
MTRTASGADRGNPVADAEASGRGCASEPRCHPPALAAALVKGPGERDAATCANQQAATGDRRCARDAGVVEDGDAAVVAGRDGSELTAPVGSHVHHGAPGRRLVRVLSCDRERVAGDRAADCRGCGRPRITVWRSTVCVVALRRRPRTGSHARRLAFSVAWLPFNTNGVPNERIDRAGDRHGPRPGAEISLAEADGGAMSTAAPNASTAIDRYRSPR